METRSFDVLGVTYQTVDRLVQLKELDALVLYMAYASVAFWQKTWQPKASNSFMIKRMGWRKQRFEKAKAKLIELKLIENVVQKDSSGKVRGWYTRIRHMVETDVATTLENEGGGLARGWENGAKVLLTKNKVLLTKESAIGISEDSFRKINQALRQSERVRYTGGRKEKLKARLKTFKLDEIITAAQNLADSPFHMGDNEGGRVYATFDFLMRNDEQVDKWLNAAEASGSGDKNVRLEDIKI